MNKPEVIKFSNEGLRPVCDKLAEAYYTAKTLLASYDATDMAGKLGTDDTFTDVLVDGSASDGRPPVSAGGVKLTMENIRALLTQLETADAGTGLTLIQGVLSISPRYRL